MESSTVHSTFVIEKNYSAAPKRVFAAFSEAEKKRRWFVEGPHHEVLHHELDFREGGREEARFRFNEGTPVAGVACVNETLYLQVATDKRIVMAQKMTLNGHCISAALVTIELQAAGGGTLLTCTHQGAFFEGADGPAMREMGWKTLLERLGEER